jgi:long-chain acyl-CoA synthetase
MKDAIPVSFASSWEQVLLERGSDPALFSADGSVLRTFSEIENERGEWRSMLADFSAGDCLVAALGNDPTWPAFFLACLDQELVLAPIEPAMQDAHVDRVLQITEAQGLILTDQIKPFDRAPVEWNGLRPDLLKITSGTTGAPRAVRTRQIHLLADCRNICRTMGIGKRDLNFGVIPFSHSYGFSNLITPLLYQGTALVCSTDRIPRAIWRHLNDSKATIFPGTPAIFQALASLEDTTDLGAVRVCISAGAPMVPEIARLFHERFGRKIHSFYGSSECGGIAYDRTENPDKPSGFVGTALDGVEIEKIGSDRIAVNGENVADAYFPEPDDLTLSGDRFLPGDLVEWSDDEIRLIGRVSDFVNVAGRKIHPLVVEEHLRKYPGVVDAIVFGIPSATRNEDLVAYVAGPEGLSRPKLEAHCRDGLSDWQVPREIQLMKTLPVNSRGKINRSELARQHPSGK